MTAPQPVAVFPAAWPCQCGHTAYAVAVYSAGRLIHHADRRIPPCPAPNPVRKGQS